MSENLTDDLAGMKLDQNLTNEQRVQRMQAQVKKMDKVSCSFCTAKWLQTTLYLQNGYNHSCHHPAPHKIPLEEVLKDPAALHNSVFKKQQRQKMIDGERPEECDYCWKIEDLNKGYYSDRHIKTTDDNWAWDRFDEIANAHPMQNINPSYLEVSFSNACNFACAYCSPDISSKWMEDIKQNGEYPLESVGAANSLNYLETSGKYPFAHNEENPYVDAFWEWFPDVFKDLKVFRITGGEPLMSKDTWKLIEWFKDKENKNCTIAFNTNLGVPDKLYDRFIPAINSLVPKFNRINVFTSLESTGDQAEYVRDGLNYEKFISNLRRLMNETTEVDVTIMTTVNILALPSFKKFLLLFLELRKEFKLGDSWANSRLTLSVNYLRWPKHLSCTLLDQDERQLYAQELEELAKEYQVDDTIEQETVFYLEDINQINRFCEFLKTSETDLHNRKDFVSFVNAYDIRRNKNFSKTFPEYVHLLEWKKDE
jgi:pyruvate-formate lyase-activating enzyme